MKEPRELPGTVESCPFCEFLRGDTELPPNFAVEGNVASFTPRKLVIPGHRIFIPRVHIEDAAESPTWAGIVVMVAATYASIRRNDFNLITCAGDWATQNIRHLHVHYVPRNPTDKIRLPWD